MSIVHNYIWDPAYVNPSGGTGGWVKQTAGGGGGTGGPVTFPSGFNVNNWPAEYAISNFPASFSVSNFPASFSVSNFPASFNVGNWPAGIPATIGPLVSAQSESVVVAPDSIVYPLLEVVMTTPTTQVAANRVLADTQVLANAVRVSGGSGKIDTISLVDPDNQKAPMSVVFFRDNVSLGTEGGAPSISDADVANYLGHVDILQSDWRDLIGSCVATVNKNITIRAAAGSRDVYAALINTALTPTFAGGGIRLKLGLL